MTNDPRAELAVTQNVDLKVRLTRIDGAEQIPERWRNSPIAELIGAHNFDQPITATGEPKLLISTCIEFRFTPIIPPMFAYVIRRASGRLIGAEFPVVYALSKGVGHIVLIGHNDCGMTKVTQHKDSMIQTLLRQGWEQERAEEFIAMHAGRYMIEDEVDSLKREFFRLLRLFKDVEIAPLFVSLATSRLYIPNWYLDYLKDPEDSEVRVRPEDLLLLP